MRCDVNLGLRMICRDVNLALRPMCRDVLLALGPNEQNVGLNIEEVRAGIGRATREDESDGDEGAVHYFGCDCYCCLE